MLFAFVRLFPGLNVVIGLSPPLPGESYSSQLLWCAARRPLGPLGFALIPHPIIEKAKRTVPGLLINTWYLDDGTLCGLTTDLRLKALSVGYL